MELTEIVTLTVLIKEKMLSNFCFHMETTFLNLNFLLEFERNEIVNPIGQKPVQ